MNKNEYYYRVDSFLTDSAGAGPKLARLIPTGDKNESAAPTRDLLLPLGDVNKGDNVRLIAEKVSTTDAVLDAAPCGTDYSRNGAYFLHHHDRVNQGDVLSGPYNYFDFEVLGKISWDRNIQKGEPAPFVDGAPIIFGGGIYFSDKKPHLMKLIRRSGKFIGWGIGLDPRSDVSRFLNKFTLLGTRERKLDLIDNRRIFYVPCVSCMNPAFDGDVQSSATGEPKTPHHEIVLHVNGGFNEKKVAAALGSYRVSRTNQIFAETIANLRNSDCVITNSYHGAYWGSLLGKKIICIKTEVPKWDGLHPNVAFADLNEIDQVLRTVKPVPESYLSECRSINNDFYELVRKNLAI